MYPEAILTLIEDPQCLKIFTTPSFIPWIPGMEGINLTGGIGSAQADLLERDSILGKLFRASFLPGKLNMQKDAEYEKMAENALSELKSCKSQASFDKIA